MNLLLPIIGQRRRAGFDPDALDYFSRAEALGGSFDQTAINALYTESYIKKAISDCIAGLKTDAVWSKITELYLMGFVTFAGLMAKVKHAGTATLTNTNFVSGDYLAAGSGAGLKGNGSANLATSFQPASNSNYSLSAYVIQSATASSALITIGTNGSNEIFRIGAGQVVVRPNFVTGFASAITTGYFIGSRRTSTDAEAYRNGISYGTTATSDNAAFSNCFLFSRPAATFFYTDARMSAAHVGTGLTDTEAANLSSRINTLMTAIGANVY